jgi:hypothetical protein
MELGNHVLLSGSAALHGGLDRGPVVLLRLFNGFCGSHRTANTPAHDCPIRKSSPNSFAVDPTFLVTGDQ